jgi:hypothetical protein
MQRLLTVTEQSPELRNALQKSPVAVTVAVDSNWDMEEAMSLLNLNFCDAINLIDAGIAFHC